MTRYWITATGSKGDSTVTSQQMIRADDPAAVVGLAIQTLTAVWNGIPLPSGILIPAGAAVDRLQVEANGRQAMIDIDFDFDDFIVAERIEGDAEAADETTPDPLDIQRAYWDRFPVHHGFAANNHVPNANTYYHRAACPICGGQAVLTVVDEYAATLVHVWPDGSIGPLIARSMNRDNESRQARFYGCRSTGPSPDAEGRIRYELRLAIAGAHSANRPEWLRGVDLTAEPPEDLDNWIAARKRRRSIVDLAGDTYTKPGHYKVQTFREPCSPKRWRYTVEGLDGPVDDWKMVGSSGYNFLTQQEALTRGWEWAESNLKD